MLVGLGLLTYVGLRVVALSFTHDESYTFTRFIDLSFVRVMTYDHWLLPNNHILNTLSMQMMHCLFGADPWALRFPNWLALGGYIAAAAGCLGFVRGRLSYVVGLVILTVNPYLLDFFGLARGYGLAIALMMGSLFCGLRYGRLSERRWLWASLVFGVLAVMANFILLNYFICLMMMLNVVFVGRWLRSDRHPSWPRFLWRENRPLLLTSAVLASVVAVPLARIVEAGTLYGGGADFWTDSVRSLVHAYLYGRPWTAGRAGLEIGVAVVSLAALIGLGRQLRRWPQEPLEPDARVTLVVLFCVAGAVVQHAWLGTPYLTGRTATFYMPLFALMAALLLGRWAATARWGRPVRTAAVALGVLVVLNFAANANLTHTLEWRYDADNERVLRDLAGLREARDGPATVNLGASWLLEPSLNFYRRTWSLSWLAPITRTLDPAVTYEYYLLLPRDRGRWRGPPLEVVTYYPVSGAMLFRNRLGDGVAWRR